MNAFPDADAEADADEATPGAQISGLLDADVLIVGGGPGGLVAALLFAEADFDVIVLEQVDPAAPGPADLRTAALLGPSVEALRRIGVADALTAEPSPRATPLSTMRVIDAGGRAGIGAEARPRADAVFEARDIDEDAFGLNVANADLRAALLARLAETPRARFVAPARLAHLALREDAVRATLADRRRISAKLVVGADGRRSTVRAALGIGARRVAFGQTALTFHVAHDPPHHGVSTEIYAEGGPFTLVPHTPIDGAPNRSAVVWMERDREAQALLALSDDRFEAAATHRSLGVLGPLRLLTERRGWPVASLLADRFHGRRGALVAEAAHVAPPIGAQGLNMSFKDAETLVEMASTARAAGRDIGAEATLAPFTRARRLDVSARVGATALLDALAIGAVGPLRDLRAIGLDAAHRFAPLRRRLMRLGMGA